MFSVYLRQKLGVDEGVSGQAVEVNVLEFFYLADVVVMGSFGYEEDSVFVGVEMGDFALDFGLFCVLAYVLG